LDPVSISRLSQVEHWLNQFISDDFIWRCLVDRDFYGTSLDKPSQITYQEQYQDLLKMTLEQAIERNRLDCLKRHRDLITINHANLIASKGHLRLLEYLDEQKIFPDNRAEFWSATQDQFQILMDESFQIYYLVSNSAAKDGSLKMIEWLDNKGILSRIQTANYACFSGRLDLVKYLISKGLLPDLYGANWAAQEGHYPLILLLEEYQLFPDSIGADWAAMNGHLELLKYLRALPTQHGANMAAMMGHLHILEFLESGQILPGEEGANLALKNNRTEVLVWLEKKRIEALKVKEKSSQNESLLS